MMIRARPRPKVLQYLGLTLLVALFCAMPVQAFGDADGELPQSGSPSAKVAVEEDAVNALIADLSSSVFTRRRAAFVELWQLGDSVLTQIQNAKQSIDVQVAQSVAVLEALVKLKIEPDAKLNLQMVEQLLEGPTPRSITNLCRLGYWKLAGSMVDESPELRAQFSEPAVLFDVGQILDIANEAGDPALAWPIIRNVIEPRVASYVAKIQGLPLPDLEPEDDQYQATVEYFSGNVEAALARQNVPMRDRISWLARSGAWKQLANQDVLDEFTGQIALPELQLAVQAAVLDLAGERDASAQLWREHDSLLALEPIGTEASADGDAEDSDAEDGDPQDANAGEDTSKRAGQGGESLPGLELLRRSGADAPLAMFTLLVDGRIEAVEKYLLETDVEYAFVFLLSNSKYGEAFEVIGLKADLSNLDDWLDEQEVELTSGPLGSVQYDRLARLANVLVNVGYTEQARQVFDMSLRAVDTVAQELRSTRRGPLKLSVWGAFASRLTRNESRQLLLKVFRDRHRELPVDIRTAMLARLYPAMSRSISILLETVPGGGALHLADPNLQLSSESWDALDSLSRGELTDKLSRADVTAWIGRCRSALSREQSPSGVVSELVEIALRFGMKDLAFTLASDPAVDPGRRHVAAAQMLIDRGNPQTASALLRGMRRYGGRNQIPLEIDALLLAGNFDEARKLQQFRMFAPLVRSSSISAADAYELVAKNLSGSGDYRRAEEYARPAFLLSEPYTLGTFFNTDTYAVCLEELEKFDESSNVRRANTLEFLHPSSEARSVLLPSFGGRSYDYLGYFVYGMQKDRMHRAVSELQRGNYKEAWHEIKVAQRIQPHDIEAVVQCYSLFYEENPESAEELFVGFNATLLDHLEQWPMDATTLNNLAWMYAKTGRRLDDALELSRRAVALAPKSDIFIDTMAEVYYQLGDTETAIELMQQCVQLNSTELHYRENLARFRSQRP